MPNLWHACTWQVLAEGEDPRVQQAAVWAAERGIADVTLLGRREKLHVSAMGTLGTA